MRPATGSMTCDIRFGFASILPGEVTLSTGTSAVDTCCTRICESFGESAGMDTRSADCETAGGVLGVLAASAFTGLSFSHPAISKQTATPKIDIPFISSIPPAGFPKRSPR